MAAAAPVVTAVPAGEMKADRVGETGDWSRNSALAVAAAAVFLLVHIVVPAVALLPPLCEPIDAVLC